jgi:hypothetical protein
MKSTIVEIDKKYSKLENFKKLFDNEKSVKRDFIISNLLGESEIQIITSILCAFSTDEYTTLITDTALVIKKMKFDVDSNYNILKLNVYFDILNNRNGKLVKEMMKYSELKIKPKIEPSSFNVLGFYISF